MTSQAKEKEISPFDPITPRNIANVPLHPGSLPSQAKMLADKQSAPLDQGKKPDAKAQALELVKAVLASFKSNAVSMINTVKDAVAALRDKKSGKAINLTVDTILTALFFGWLFLMALLIKLLSPSPAYLFSFTLVGMGIGLALSFLYYSNLKQKHEVNEMMGTTIGIKGLQFLSGSLPSWLSYTEQEKMEWFNTIIAEIWPFVDAAVCKKVKEEVEKACDNALKSAKFAIKKVGFRQLTFGDAPFRVEVRLEQETVIWSLTYLPQLNSEHLGERRLVEWP